MPGSNKSDVSDCPWLQQLHSCGLLSKSFVPTEQIRMLRTGKSSFALLLASSFRDAANKLPKHLYKVVAEILPGLRRDNYVPVLVVGSRQSMGLAILRGLSTAINSFFNHGKKSDIAQSLDEIVEKASVVSEDEVTHFLEWAAEKITASGRAKGLILILDEVGKFLEYAALEHFSMSLSFSGEVIRLLPEQGGGTESLSGRFAQKDHCGEGIETKRCVGGEALQRHGCTSSVSPVGGPANLIDAAGGRRQGRKYNFPDYCIPKYNLGTRRQRRFIPTLIARRVFGSRG